MANIISEFNKLTQEGSLQEYQERFEDLRSMMLKINPTLDETYFISNFTSGLNKELKPIISLYKSQTLNIIYEQAFLQSQHIEAVIITPRFEN